MIGTNVSIKECRSIRARRFRVTLLQYTIRMRSQRLGGASGAAVYKRTTEDPIINKQKQCDHIASHPRKKERKLVFALMRGQRL